MKKQLLTLAGGIMLVATVAKVLTIPAVAQTIRAAFVKNIDEKGRNPYSQPLFCDTQSNADQSCIINAPAIPSGMRLVVENINLRIQGPALGSAEVDLIGDDNFRYQQFNPTYGSTDGTTNYLYLNATVSEFIDAGIQPTVQVRRRGTTGLLYQAQGRITGYLVNLNN